MRWLWKDWPQPVKVGQTKNNTLDAILIPGEDWQLVAEGYKFTEGPAANAKGEVFFNDVPASKTYKVGLDGKVSVFIADSKTANGQAFGPDGRLYAVAAGDEKIVAYDAGGKAAVIADGFRGNDIVVAGNGNIYVTNPIVEWHTTRARSGSSSLAARRRSWTAACATRTASRCRPIKLCST